MVVGSSTIAGPSTLSPAGAAFDAEPGSPAPVMSRPAAVEIELPQLRLRERSDGARLPVDALDVLPGLLHGEDALVDVVEALDHRRHVAFAVEAAFCEGHFELPDLVRVARLDEELLSPRALRCPETIEELVELAFEQRESFVHRGRVEPVRVRATADAELGDDVGELAAAGRERGRSARDEDASTAERLREPADREACGASPCDDDRVARVETLVDRDVANRAHHVLVGNGEHRVGRLLDLEPERLRDLGANGVRGPLRVELDPAAEEVLGVDVAEHQSCIGHGRLLAAPAVADGSGHGAGAVGPDAEEAAWVDPGDAPPARADALDVDRRQAGHVPREHASKPGLARELDVAAADQAHVEARAAHVADDRVRRFAGVDAAGDRRHRRSRIDRVDRASRNVVEIQNAAERAHDEQLAREARRTQVFLHLPEMSLHQRLQRGIDRGRRRAPVLADDRIEAV